jgi:D-beta-D-heptose 7-phosphate kinase/D-beta-D-heptose 1-phosphate adenosyltransferase
MHNLRKTLGKVSKLSVLVVGDVMLDEYVFGDAHRISPEAPVPVVSFKEEKHVAGGSANVALNVVSFGAKAELSGWIGADAAGGRLRALLAREKVAFDARFVRPETTTIVKTRIVAGHQQLCRLDREESPPSYELRGLSVEWIREKIPDASALIFSDYAKGSLSPALLKDLLKVAQKHRVFVALDPKPRRPLEVKGLDLLTPNWREALEMSGYSPELPQSAMPGLNEVQEKIFKKYNPRYLVITLGEKGMLLRERHGPFLPPMKTYAREVFDVSGAGDTVVAALTLALAAKSTLAEAAHFANTAAGVVVGKFGTATASPEEILKYHP